MTATGSVVGEGTRGEGGVCGTVTVGWSMLQAVKGHTVEDCLYGTLWHAESKTVLTRFRIAVKTGSIV